MCNFKYLFPFLKKDWVLELNWGLSFSHRIPVHLLEIVYMFIRCNKTKFFLWNTNNTDRNGVNKQKTHTKHLEKDNIRKGGGFQLWACMLLNFQFLTVQEKQVMTSTLLNLRFFKKHKPAFFFEKVYANKLKVKKVSLNVPNFCRK